MKKLCVFGLGALMSITSMAQNGPVLKLNMEKNKVYRFNSVTEQTVSQTVNGNQQNVNSKTQYTLSLKLLDATADFLITEARFDTIVIQTNTMGKTTLISSVTEGNIASSETGEIMSAIMNRLSKNALFVKMDYSGKALEIVNSKMLSDIILRDTSSVTLTGPVAAAVKTQIQGMVSDNSLKTMVEMFTWNLPVKQVSAGDQWSITQQLNSGGMILDIITDYQLDKVSGDMASISAESNIKATENAAPINSGGAKVTYDDLKGLSKYDMLIDVRTGLLVGNKSKSHIAGNLGVSGPGFSLQIPMDINGETKVSALPE